MHGPLSINNRQSQGKSSEIIGTIENHTVSIIIPVYNVESFIEACIRSVIEQTYNEIECIIVDDKSTDRSNEICDRVLSDYNGTKRFKTIILDGHLGLSEARNTGIKAATGQWIYFLDSEDSLAPDAIFHLVSLFRKYPTADIAIGQIVCPQAPERYRFAFCETTNYIEGDGIGEYLLFTEKIPVNAWDKLIRRDLIVNNNLMFEPELIHEDEMWMYSASRHFNKIAFARDNTYIHNLGVNPNSIMSTATLQRTRDNWNIILTNILDAPANHHKDKAILRYLKSLLAYYKFVPDNGASNELFKRFLEQLKASGNRRLVALLKIYDRLPFGILRSQLRRGIFSLISARQYR